MILPKPSVCVNIGEPSLAAFFAAFHDGFVEAVAEGGGHLVDFVGAVDFDGLAGGVESDFAVLAAAEVFLEVGAHLSRHGVIDHVVEHGQKLSARHFSLPFPWEPSSA